MSYFLARRRVTRPDQPQPVYKGALGNRLWEGSLQVSVDDAARNGSYCPPSRARLDVRGYEWAPSFAWVAQAVDRVVATWTPAWTAERNNSDRTPARPPLDLLKYEWNPEFGWINRAVDLTVRTWLPTFGTPLGSDRLRDRPSLDVRDWSARLDWLTVNIPVAGPTTAQAWPAIHQALGLSYRSLDRTGLDVRASTWQPGSDWTATASDRVIATWLPVWDAEVSYRQPDGVALDLRKQEWSPEAGWLTPGAVDPVTRTWTGIWPAELRTGERTADRSRLDVRGYDWSPEFGWAPLSADRVVATWLPAFETARQSYRQGDDAQLEVRRPEWAPQSGWLQPAVDAIVRTWLPALLAELSSERSRDRRVLEVRDWAARFDWLIAALAPPPTAAQIWPALLEALGLSYRSTDRSVLDVRSAPWQPSPDWVARSVDAVVKTWVPAFGSVLGSDRSPERARLDLRDIAARIEWITATLPAGGPTTAQLWPALLQALMSASVAPRAGLEVRSVDPMLSAWLARTVDASVARWVPAFGTPIGADRVRDRARADARDIAARLEWIAATFGPTAAQIWPAILQALSLVAAPGPRILVAPDAAPSLAWVARSVDAIVRTWPPIFDAERSGTRSPDRRVLDLREWIAQPAWITDPVQVQFFPAMKAALETFRQPDRLRLDVRRDTEDRQSVGWVQRVTDGLIACQVPVYDVERIARALRRLPGDVRYVHPLDVAAILEHLAPTQIATTLILLYGAKQTLVELLGAGESTITLPGVTATLIDLLGSPERLLDLFGTPETLARPPGSRKETL